MTCRKSCAQNLYKGSPHSKQAGRSKITAYKRCAIELLRRSKNLASVQDNFPAPPLRKFGHKAAESEGVWLLTRQLSLRALLKAPQAFLIGSHPPFPLEWKRRIKAEAAILSPGTSNYPSSLKRNLRAPSLIFTLGGLKCPSSVNKLKVEA